MNVKQLIDSAMRLIGINNSSPNEYNDALFALNALLSSWSTSFYLNHSQTINTFPISANKAVYTMGIDDACDWIVDAPVRVENINYKLANTEFEIEIFKEADYASLAASSYSAAYPTHAVIQYNRINTITFWPKPLNAGEVIVYSWALLPEYANLTDIIDLPAGYIQAIKFNLALELAPEFGITPLQAVNSEALRSLNALVDENSTRKPYKITYDGYTKRENIASKTHGYVV